MCNNYYILNDPSQLIRVEEAYPTINNINKNGSNQYPNNITYYINNQRCIISLFTAILLQLIFSCQVPWPQNNKKAREPRKSIAMIHVMMIIAFLVYLSFMHDLLSSLRALQLLVELAS